MLVNYKKEYVQSLLSYVAYANMDGSEDGDLKWDNLINTDLSIVDNSERFKLNFSSYLVNKNGNVSGTEEFLSIIFSLDFFTSNFKIIKQVVERGFNGFSATTYQLQNDIDGTDFKAGQVFVSYRGTEISAADFVTDFNLAFSFRTGEGPTVTFFNSIYEHNKI